MLEKHFLMDNVHLKKQLEFSKIFNVIVNVLKIQTLVAWQKGLDKIGPTQIRLLLIRVCPVCYSDIHVVNSSPDN